MTEHEYADTCVFGQMHAIATILKRMTPSERMTWLEVEEMAQLKSLVTRLLFVLDIGSACEHGG